mmetsp:Transcript_51482/g.129176  ORF Transcript_51482/g.129176 Transcript_51482/m.129176 type:complete len:97 (-) Transcript_51482:37-327(-)
MSSSCVPVSITCPSSMTTILSAFRTVANRCATTTTVRPFISMSSCPCSASSVCESTADVASSRISSGGFCKIALAIAILCFWPPDSAMPRLPTTVL